MVTRRLSLERSERSSLDAPGNHEPLAPIRLLEIVAANPPMALAGLDHHAVALVQSHVGDERLACVSREEEKVARLQSPYVVAERRLVDGPPRQIDAELLIDVLREPGAVECISDLLRPTRTGAQSTSRRDRRHHRRSALEAETRKHTGTAYAILRIMGHLVLDAADAVRESLPRRSRRRMRVALRRGQKVRQRL